MSNKNYGKGLKGVNIHGRTYDQQIKYNQGLNKSGAGVTHNTPTTTNTKKKGPFKKIRKKIAKVTEDWNADALGNAANVFGDISEKTKGTFTSVGGIQSQGGPDKVAFRSEDYDTKTLQILKKLNSDPYA